MCGIVAYIGTEPYDPKDIKILMLANMWRGADASGFFTPTNGIVKNTDRIDEFLAEVGNEIEPGNLFIGHVRKSTYANSDKKAHPFSFLNITGVHNGTLTGHAYLKSQKYSHIDYLENNSIDSELLIAGLNYGYDILKWYDGAAALIWYDARTPDRLNFFHDKERPLFRGYKQGLNGMFLSSTEESLKIIGCHKIVAVNENVVYIASRAGIIASRCKVIKRDPFKYSSPPARTNNSQSNITASRLLEAFDMSKYVENFTKWAIVNEDKAIFSPITEQNHELKDLVYVLNKVPRSSYYQVFSPSTATMEFVNYDAFEFYELTKGRIFRIIDLNAWELITEQKVAVIDEIIKTDNGIYYQCDVYKYTNKDKVWEVVDILPPSDFLGMELAPIIDYDIYTSLEKSINKLEQ